MWVGPKRQPISLTDQASVSVANGKDLYAGSAHVATEDLSKLLSAPLSVSALPAYRGVGIAGEEVIGGWSLTAVLSAPSATNDVSMTDTLNVRTTGFAVGPDQTQFLYNLDDDGPCPFDECMPWSYGPHSSTYVASSNKVRILTRPTLSETLDARTKVERGLITGPIVTVQ